MREHPTRTELERLSVDDLPPALAATTRAHVTGCRTCGALLEELGRAGESYFAAHPPGRFMDGVEERKARRSLLRWPLFALLPGTAVAAIAILLVMRPGAGTRYKGGGIDVLRRQGELTQQLGPDDRIAAGDELGFVLLRPHAGPAAAWAVDAAGRVDPLTAGSIVLSAGDQRLPQSAVVEAPCRDLTLLATDDPAWLDATPEVLRKAAQSATPPAGLTVRRLRCR